MWRELVLEFPPLPIISKGGEAQNSKLTVLYSIKRAQNVASIPESKFALGRLSRKSPLIFSKKVGAQNFDVNLSRKIGRGNRATDLITCMKMHKMNNE